MSDDQADGECEFGAVTRADLGLFTDLYELTMAQGYLAADHTPRATFDLFVRELPPDRGYLVAAGLEQVVAYLEGIEFRAPAIDYLRDQGFGEPFLEWLAAFEFTGDVRAVPEGTPVFPNEPMVEVTAPIPQAQLFETLFINQVGYQTLVATKAARMRDVVRRHGDGQSLVDFGTRRAHGTDAGLKLGRAAYIGGFDGTSNALTGERFGVPVSGTMAHSWIQSFESERAAFEAFVDQYGEDSILLADTYDTHRGVELAKAVAAEQGVDIAGVRLDSGDLVALSKAAAETLPDSMGVFVSSGMDEYRIKEFLDAGGVATGFGPGTALATSADAPKLEIVYKLVAVERDGELAPTMKLSEGKQTYPGQKAIRRVEGADGYNHDVLGLRDEIDEDDLLGDVYRDGEVVYDTPDLEDVKARVAEEVQKVPVATRAIEGPEQYPVETTDGLQRAVEGFTADPPS
ncbi:MAG: nicotinate phosphoribosyltransferase [Halobacteriales archaeon]